MNSLLNTTNGQPILKDSYPTSATPLQTALKQRRQKLSNSLLGPSEKSVSDQLSGENKLLGEK